MGEFTVEALINSSAIQIYNDWLDSEKHSSFTGGSAEISNEEGANHTAWDGYIWGELLELTEGKRILMSWKTSEFPETSNPSLVEVLFEDTKLGCKITINHSKIPENQESNYEIGWIEHYFNPMKMYYS